MLYIYIHQVTSGGDDDQGDAPVFEISQLPQPSRYPRVYCGLPGTV